MEDFVIGKPLRRKDIKVTLGLVLRKIGKAILQQQQMTLVYASDIR